MGTIEGRGAPQQREKTMDYPKPLSLEVGCKVSWRTYSTLHEAKQAAEIARNDAEEAEAMGFDFGYLIPSSIRKNEDHTYTVVCP